MLQHTIGGDGQVAHPMLPAIAIVRSTHKETKDTFTLEFASNADEISSFLPGQFNMVYVFGVGEVPISISGDPAKGSLCHTTREVGTVTRAMRRLRKGDMVGLRGPFGTSWPVDDIHGRDVIVLAGGIGLAPLRPVLYHLLQHRETYGRIVLMYGARTPEDLLFRSEIGQWSSRLDVDVHVTVDRATRQWHGNVGVITTLIPRAPFAPDNAVALICGPEIMMRFTIQELTRRGMEPDQMYLSMERNMKCAIGLCGHCQFGPHFVCLDGPVFRFDEIQHLFSVREL